jgi:hypothetical protein
MDKTHKLVEKYLITIFGDSPVFEYVDNISYYEPYTFQSVKHRKCWINNKYVCNFDFYGDGNEIPLRLIKKIKFDDKLIRTIQSLFNLEQNEVVSRLTVWFYNTIWKN